MIIKSPPAYDVSHWKEIPDFAAVDPRPVLFITKATEAYPGFTVHHTDEKFIRFMEGFQSIGCTRGMYHFHRKAADARRQADHFLNVISQLDILSTDFLILDVEEGGEKASQLWTWFEAVRKAYPQNLLMLYSRATVLNPMPMTEGEKAYFKKIPIWGAGYPFFPDLFSAPPKGYIPDQTKFGPMWLWQYSEVGKIPGIIGAVDLNWVNPGLYSAIGNSTIGETMALNAKGKCINGNNKAWGTIGGQVLGAYLNNAPVAIDNETTVAGVKYVHITAPLVKGIACWSKAQWFAYAPVVVDPPTDPEPEPEPTDPDYITAHWANGTTKKYIPE